MHPLAPLGPQLKLLLEFLHGLKPFGIQWRLSPNGALLQHRGRMVAMLLMVGTRLQILPFDGRGRHFDLEVPGHEEEAVEFIEQLKEERFVVGK